MSDKKHAHPGVSRRTVARTAAWAVPVVITAVGAPAYAATSGAPCTDSGTGTMVTGAPKPPPKPQAGHPTPGPNIVSSLAFFDATDKPTGVTASVDIFGTDANHNPLSAARIGDTGQVGSTEYTPGWDGILLRLPKGMKQGDTETLTLTFNKPVQSFTLTVTDIDAFIGDWIDEVFVSPSGYAVTAKGPNVVGTGVAGDPFTSHVQEDIDTPDGDLTLTWPGSVTQVVITYVAGDTKNGSTNGEHIVVGEFAYDNCA